MTDSGVPPEKAGRIRRDPFTERQTRRGAAPPAAEGSATAAGPPAPGARVRRDPFAEKALRAAPAPLAPAAPTGRVRRDPFADGPARGGLASSRPGGEAAEAPAGDQAPTREAEPACLIFVLPDLPDGRLSSHDRDLLGAARLLADRLAGAVVAIASGAVADLGAAGADRRLALGLAEDDRYQPEVHAAALAAEIQAWQPRHVLFAEGACGGGDLGRRVAAALGERPATNVVRFRADGIVRRGRGGASDFLLDAPRVLIVAEEAADPWLGTARPARPVEPRGSAAAQSRVTDLGLLAIDPNTVPLAEADLILSAGNGVGDWAAFHRAAAALGAAEGGSRVVCDAGHLPRARQVGASGTIVKPRCYLAFGISGATQHLEGIAACERVVAVNSDRHAAMIKRADLAIVGDADAVLRALIAMKDGEHGRA